MSLEALSGPYRLEHCMCIPSRCTILWVLHMLVLWLVLAGPQLTNPPHPPSLQAHSLPPATQCNTWCVSCLTIRRSFRACPWIALACSRRPTPKRTRLPLPPKWDAGVCLMLERPPGLWEVSPGHVLARPHTTPPASHLTLGLSLHALASSPCNPTCFHPLPSAARGVFCAVMSCMSFGVCALGVSLRAPASSSCNPTRFHLLPMGLQGVFTY
jgi:hypothetical protein